MYINFKSKYKKIIWLIVGFLLACICVQKVNALPTFAGTEQQYNFNNFNFVYNNHIYNKAYIYELLNTNLQQNNKSFDDYKLIFISVPTQPTTQQNDRGYINISLISNDNVDFFRWGAPWIFAQFIFTSQVTSANFKISLNTGEIYSSYYANSSISQTIDMFCGESSSNTNNIYTNYVMEWSKNQSTYSNTIYSNFYYDSNMLSTVPDYLTGYKKITLTTEDKYYMLSGLSSGSVYIPTTDFEEYGGRLSYYDNDLSSQPYTSYIQDYYKMPDGEFIRQDFDLSQFSGADWVMFSKYIYLEGEDNISYDIWVPNDIYDSQVTITPNSSGGNTFDFDYQDSNGDIQTGQVNSIDLSQDNPLLGNIFSDFSSNTFGLTSIITAPLSLIRSLSSTSCSSLNVPLPYISSNLSLPCMSTIYSNTFGSFFTLYQTITTGIISYWVIVKIFNLVKDFKNPDHDEIEVIDL